MQSNSYIFQPVLPQAFTVESRHLMSRPGLRCPASLPIPISTVGVNCIGRVVQSSAHAALHGIMFRDRVCAIYPFEYEKKRVWNKGSRGFACVDAGFALSIPKHVDAAEASTLLHIYTPAFQSIQTGIAHTKTSWADNRHNSNQLAGQSILIQNGNTAMGLALIELALVLGAEEVFATASSVHHSLLESVGAIPLVLVEKKGDNAWETWKILQANKVGLVIMQDMPSLLVLDMFMGVLGENGRIVLMSDVKQGNEENQENTSSEKKDDSVDIFDVVEKARIAHEKQSLEHRIQTCTNLATYDGVLSNIVDDPLVWKNDVSFLMSLLAQGTIKPRVNKRIYSRKEAAEVQERMEIHTELKTIVCLPSKKWANDNNSNSSVRAVLGDCSLKTKNEGHSVTQIAAAWRKFAAQRAYKCTIRGKLPTSMKYMLLN